MDQHKLSRMFDYLQGAVERNETPGIVALAGGPKGTYRKAVWGDAQQIPCREPMTADITFDLASLSKLVGTWMCLLPLLQAGTLTLDTRLEEAIGFGVRGDYRDVTIWNLLTHTAGFIPGMHVDDLGCTREARIKALLNVPRAEYERGTKVVYSDISFICLGEIVARMYGKSLDKAARGLWDQLGMKNTCYNPAPEVCCAATEMKEDGLRRGKVHDEVAYALGGVAGHAGVFSTAEDLAAFCRAVLPESRHSLFDPEWLKRSYENQTGYLGENRCLGWIAYRERPEGNMVGHTGFTGTSIWMDTASSEYVIILSNRVHPSRESHSMVEIRKNAMEILFGS